jgi:serine/threonine-protein kinase
LVSKKAFSESRGTREKLFMINWTEMRRKLMGEVDAGVAPPKLNLPPISAVVAEFGKAADDPKLTHADLAAILDRDPALVVELLKIVNSAASGVRNRISTSKMAIALLGARRSKLLVLTSGAKKATGGAKSPFGTPNQFAFAAMQRAVFARHVARHLKVDEDLAFAGALLQDFPVPSLTAERPDQYRALLEQMTVDAPSVAVFEKKRFGWDHALAGARLIQAWGFPDELICLVLAHHWLDAIRANPLFNRSELMAVAISALLPDPIDARPSRSNQAAELLLSDLRLETSTLPQRIADELESSGVTPEPELRWQVEV